MNYSTRLKNIEETEKAKRAAAEQRRERRNEDEERLAATRCKPSIFLTRPFFILTIVLLVYKPNLRQKSDADIIRDAKLEAMGLRPDDHEHRRPHNDRPQTATDELVCSHNDFLSVEDFSHSSTPGHGTIQEEDAQVTAHRLS